MQNITTSQSLTVKIHAPEWFKQPDFQAWYNRKLGQGLATWQNTLRPLDTSAAISAPMCQYFAHALKENIINADVFYEPARNLFNSFAEFEEDQASVKASEQAIIDIAEILESGANGEGAGIEQINLIDQKLTETDIIDSLSEAECDEEMAQYYKAVNTIEALDKCVQAQRVKASDDNPATSFADCFVTVEPESAEGSDSDLPEPYWDIVVKEAHKRANGQEDCQIVVWISPV